MGLVLWLLCRLLEIVVGQLLLTTTTIPVKLHLLLLALTRLNLLLIAYHLLRLIIIGLSKGRLSTLTLIGHLSEIILIVYSQITLVNLVLLLLLRNLLSGEWWLLWKLCLLLWSKLLRLCCWILIKTSSHKWILILTLIHG